MSAVAPTEQFAFLDATVRLTETEATTNLATLLQLCAAGRMRCSEKTRRPSAATVGEVAHVLVQGDFYDDIPIASYAWPLLVQAGGLASNSSGKLTLTPRGRSAAKQPAEAIRSLWQRWLSSAVIDEMSRIEQIKGQRSPNVLTAAKPRRQTVAEALDLCPGGEWVQIDDLFTTMRRHRLSPSVVRSERALWRLYIEDAQYGSLGYDGYHDWPVLEGRYTMCVLFEYAATLGLVDVAYIHPARARDDFRDRWGADELDFLSKYDGLLAIRVNSLGEYVTGRTDSYRRPDDAMPGRHTLRVLPNLDIVATGELSPAERLVLDAYAARTSERVWSLSMASLLAAVDAGRGLAELRRFLDRIAAHELPSTVTRLLDDADGRAQALHDLGVCRVIECRDAAVATLIARDRSLGAYVRHLGDRHLAVPVDRERAFRTRLRALGYVVGAN